jgi:hypothetical protein
MTLGDLLYPAHPPQLLEEDATNGLAIRFGNGANRRAYLNLRPADPKIARGTDTDD